MRDKWANSIKIKATTFVFFKVYTHVRPRIMAEEGSDSRAAKVKGWE